MRDGSGGAGDAGRVLVAMDAAVRCLTSVEAAVDLASRLGAEVSGLFVEEENLLEPTDVPADRRGRLWTDSGGRFDAGPADADVRVPAHRAEQHLVARAMGRKVNWSFRVVRGRVLEALAAAAEEADYLVVQALTWPLTRQVHLDAPARAALGRTGKSLLMLQPGGRLEKRVLAVYDGSDRGDRVLDAALHLEEGGQGFLDVVAVTDSPRDSLDLELRAERRLKPSAMEVRCRHLPGGGLNRLCDLVEDYPDRLLVLGAECRRLEGMEPHRLLETFSASIFLVR